jgi:hypothetical protein
MKCAASSVLLTFEITAACDEFPATKRVRRGRRGAAAQKRIQRRCRKAMHAEHADASVWLQDRRSRIRYRRARVAGIESQAEPRPSLHPRVLRASPRCICAEILALRCRGPMLAHALPGRRRRTRFWRYTLARRMYGALFWLRPTAALRALRASPSCICYENLDPPPDRHGRACPACPGHQS